MKLTSIKLLFLILSFLLSPVFCMAYETFPFFPIAFWGNATVDDEPLPTGTIIKAYCGNSLIGEITMVENGIYGYTEAAKNKLLVSNCDSDILFKYLPQGRSKDLTGGVEVKYTEGFVSGTTINKDLNFINTQSCSITNGTGVQSWDGNNWGDCIVLSCNTGYYKSGNRCIIYTSGGGGGGGVSYVPTAQKTIQEVGTGKIDMNGDGKIDFDDFSVFALLYKKTYANPEEKVGNIPINWGDFNSDGKVDFDDFAIFALSYGK